MAVQDLVMDDVVQDMAHQTPMGHLEEKIVNTNAIEYNETFAETMDIDDNLLHSLPKSISDIKLGFHQTARLSRDENGVMSMLDEDEQSEIDAFAEGIDNEDVDVDDIILG